MDNADHEPQFFERSLFLFLKRGDRYWGVGGGLYYVQLFVRCIY